MFRTQLIVETTDIIICLPAGKPVLDGMFYPDCRYKLLLYGRMTICLFEYDTQIALDEGKVTGETLTVTFPNTAVLYL